MSEIKLSVVVITKNEEIDLPGFLQNFLPIADELVVIDDGSIDRTEAIARAAGPKVRFIQAERQEGQGFCDLRQKGVETAYGEWLLQVDCDMRLSCELADQVQVAINNQEMQAFRFRLAQFFCNRPVRYGGFQYWNSPWLSRRVATSWTQKVHERIFIAGGPSKIGQLHGRMWHLNDIDFNERLQKNRLYSSLDLARLEKQKITLFDVVWRPLWYGFRSYVLMRGFLDGRVGLFWGIYQIYSNLTPLLTVWSKRNSGVRSEIEGRIANSFDERR